MSHLRLQDQFWFPLRAPGRLVLIAVGWSLVGNSLCGTTGRGSDISDNCQPYSKTLVGQLQAPGSEGQAWQAPTAPATHHQSWLGASLTGTGSDGKGPIPPRTRIDPLRPSTRLGSGLGQHARVANGSMTIGTWSTVQAVESPPARQLATRQKQGDRGPNCHTGR